MSDELESLDDFDDDLDLTLYADQAELLQEVTTQLIEVIETGLRVNGIFHLALTGGTLGSDLTRALVANWNAHPEVYQGLHIWCSDERFVERSKILKLLLKIILHNLVKPLWISQSLDLAQTATLHPYFRELHTLID